MKRLLAYLLLLCTSYAETSGIFTYTIADGEVTITDVDDTDLTHLTIPDTLGDLPVTSFNTYAFSSDNVITTLTLPNSIASIEGTLFSNLSNLESVSFSSPHPSYTSVGGILYSNDLTTLICYPAGITDSDWSIPLSTSILTERCIANPHLERLYLHEGVTTLEANNTYHCYYLLEYIVDENNPHFSTLDGILYSKDMSILIHYPSGITATEFHTPPSLKSIPIWAVRSPAHLTHIYLNEGLLEMHRSSIYSPIRLEYIYFPSTLNEIPQGPLAGYIKYIEVAPDNPNYTSIDGILFSKDQTTLVRLPPRHSEYYEVPDNVTTISNFAFSFHRLSLKGLHLPDSVTTIERLAFFQSRFIELHIPPLVNSLDLLTYNRFSTIENVYIYRSELSEGSLIPEYTPSTSFPYNYDGPTIHISSEHWDSYDIQYDSTYGFNTINGNKVVQFDGGWEKTGYAQASFKSALGADTSSTVNQDSRKRGVRNGIAYGLGIPLSGALTEEHRARLPRGGISEDRSEVSLSFTLPTDIPEDVTYCVSSTNALGDDASWTELARKTGSNSWTNASSVEQTTADQGTHCLLYTSDAADD